MRYEILEQLIVDAGLGIPGQTLFTHHMPAEVDKGILLRGPLAGIEVDNCLPGYYKTDIQAIVRAQTFSAGQTLSENVVTALIHNQSKTYSLHDPDPSSPLRQVIKINHFLLKALPIIYPRSDGNSLEWSLHFDANYVML